MRSGVGLSKADGGGSATDAAVGSASRVSSAAGDGVSGGLSTGASVGATGASSSSPSSSGPMVSGSKVTAGSGGGASGAGGRTGCGSRGATLALAGRATDCPARSSSSEAILSFFFGAAGTATTWSPSTWKPALTSRWRT